MSRALGGALGLPATAVEALDDVYERWDGRGIPGGRRGEELSLLGRVVHVAEQAVFAHAEGGRVAACAEVARRAGGHLDPDLAAAFLDDADALLAVLDAPDMLAAVVAAEPGAGTTVGVEGLSGSERTVLRAAGLVHDLGRAAVSSEVWDRPGPLGTADWERVRLHAYWTDRILRRCPGLAALAELAAAHHERCDGSGYHRGVHAAELPFAARLLAAADVFAAATDTRPYRPAMTGERARELLQVEAAGRLDHQACAAVIEGAGLPRPRRVWPCELTDREVEVLRLAARGLSNRGIAAELVVSERTVGHHLTHVYDKTGRRTRAGAAVFAIEHGLLPE
ncbi:HD domain-containing phosphohydrolase [Pseudonocardia sp. GCM10023141]|uniref:HD domain-containing phosphohydrolase n=1 Tax=Pseudonocardia sp. GCM10023141 TaxID=3252653 RepID=UPI00361E4247